MVYSSTITWAATLRQGTRSFNEYETVPGLEEERAWEEEELQKPVGNLFFSHYTAGNLTRGGTIHT